METRVEGANRIEMRLAIEALNADFCYFLDHGLVAELAELFTEDAEYRHGDRISRGREEIRTLFTARLAAGVRTSRHLQTGLRINLIDECRAEGRSVCLTFAADSLPPITPAVPFLVADFIDEYRLGSDGCWRISKRHIERIFTDIDNVGPVGLQGKSSGVSPAGEKSALCPAGRGMKRQVTS